MADFSIHPGMFDVDGHIFDIDSLVDDSLTNTGTLDENLYDDCSSIIVQMQKEHEKSPFHESDSGVSELSVKSPSWDMNLELDNMLLHKNLDNMETGPFTELSHDLQPWAKLDDITDGGESKSGSSFDNLINGSSFLDESAANFLDGASFVNETITSEDLGNRDKLQENRPQATARPRLAESCQIVDTKSRNNSPKRPSLCRVSVSDESELSDRDTDISSANISSRLRRKPKGSVRVSQRGAKLPTAVTNSSKCNVTSVKVLRIVNPDSESKAENFIEKALEERNRKNAEMARQNRLKKKAYVENLEEQVENYKSRVDRLESTLNTVEEERDSYQKECDYLRSVLANESSLASLLKNIPNVKGVTLSSSLCRKRVSDSELDHSYTPISKARYSKRSGDGMCLHVNDGRVSLEACHHCAAMASGMSS